MYLTRNHVTKGKKLEKDEGIRFFFGARRVNEEIMYNIICFEFETHGGPWLAPFICIPFSRNSIQSNLKYTTRYNTIECKDQ